MNRKFIITVFTILLIVFVEARKTSGRSRGSGSGRGSSKKTNYNPQPAPTSFSAPQASAPKPTLFGWQERPAQKSNTQTLSSWQSKPSSSQSHSYPSSGSGLSGDKSKQPSSHQENIQRSSASSNTANQQHSSNQQGHAYPSSNGLSGSSGSGNPQSNANKYPQSPASSLSGSGNSGHSYPQQQGSGNIGTGQSGYPQSHGSGLSGNGQPGGYPQQHASGSGYPHQQHGSGVPGSAAAPPPYTPYNHGQNNYGNNYHPQGPPPPYSNYGSHYGGVGGHGSYNPGYGYGSQAPGYFGNYGKGYGGVSRTGSALTGVGIAGAGIGTVLTGLALWNLARSTGNHHHTVIYDNRGQPVAVAPANDTAPVADSILADLVNCSLTINNDDKTEVLAIPCSIATSFTPEADVKDSGVNQNTNDSTKCTITVLTKAGKEFMTTIPCSILLNTAAENNVTEPPLLENEAGNLSNATTSERSTQNGTLTENNTPLSEPTALKLSGEDISLNNDKLAHLNCTPLHTGEIRDPINPCFSVNHNLTVIPLPATEAPQ